MNFKTGNIPWNKGKNLSDEIKQKMSMSHIGLQIGEKNPMWGKHLTDEAKQKIREKNLGKYVSDETKQKISKKRLGMHFSIETRKKISENNPRYYLGKHFSEEHKRKMRKNHADFSGRKNHMYGKHHTLDTIKKILNNKPSGSELYLDFLLQNYFPDEWKFVGCGEVFLGHLCPDFINCNGKKQIIELFGEHWHTGGNISYTRTEEGRKKTFKELGYDTLIIWDYELNEENEIINKIREWSDK